MLREMAEEIHVVLFPYLAFGHMMPTYQLAVALAGAGIHVSYVCTPRNIQRFPKPPPHLSPLINFVSIPFPSPEGSPLPPGAESTVDVPMEQIQHLNDAYDLLEQPFRDFVAANSPDFIVIDFIPYWAADVATEHNIPLVIFTGFSTAAHVFFGPAEYLAGDGKRRVRPSPESLTAPPPWVDFQSSVAFRKHEAEAVCFVFLRDSDGPSMSAPHRMAKTLRACQSIAVRSCRELEGDYLELYSKVTSRQVIPVGLLPPETPTGKEFSDELWKKTFKWLDDQRPRSVVFVGFGSQCKLSEEEVDEIANGLEQSELPFLWSLQKPSWAADEAEALPAGFTRRTSGRGRVCFGWAPQLAMLSHPSIGGTLTHSGWGTLIETLQFGHWLVVLPFIFDQCLNARLMVEKGLAVEVERGQDGKIVGDAIARALKEAATEEEKEESSARRREAVAFAGDRKLHDNYILEFAEYLRCGVVKQKLIGKHEEGTANKSNSSPVFPPL